ncbi:MAG: TonB-dependent receptor [Bacteroidia bacterium]|nr:TonB-dependent receptor [Bacteroidia bacterium]
MTVTNRYLKIFFLSLIISSTQLVKSQNQTDKDLNEIIVSENRSQTLGQPNRMIQTIGAQEILNSSSRTLTEVLENTAGIDIRSRGAFGTQADIQIRGGSFEQTLVLLNGVKFSDPQTGHHMLNLPISLLDIERIEILKGAAARVFGQNAYAGVVNIITKKAKGKNVTVQMAAGQNRLFEQLVSANLEGKHIQQRLSLNQISSDGYRTNTDFKNQQVFYQATKEFKKSSLELNSGYLNKKMGANGFYSDRFPWQYEEIETSFGMLSYQYSGWLNLKSHVNYRRLHDRFQLKRDTPAFSQNLHLNEVLSGDISVGQKNALGAWNVGAEWRQESIRSNNLGNRTRVIYSAFAEQQIHWKQWRVVPGLCLNNYSDFGMVLYPAIDIGFSPKKWHFAAHVAQTFRVPTFTELYYTDGGKSSIGNSELNPETALSWELNSRYQTTGWKANLAYFSRLGRQQIDWIKNAASDPSWLAVNLGNIHTEGVDFAWQIKPNYYFKNMPINSIQLGYCYTQISKPNSDYVSRYVFDYLRQQFSLNLQTKLYKALQANLRLRYEERVGYQAYWLCDAKLAWQKPKYQIFAEASNLFDERYFEVGKVEMPGRWLRAGFALQIGK